MPDIVSLKDLLPKPGYLAPCNNCGSCCLMAQCSISLLFFGQLSGVCPALERTGEKTFGCGLMARPRDFLRIPAGQEAAFGEAMAIIQGAGNGCDAPTEAEWTEQGSRELMRRARASWDAASPEAHTILLAIGARRPPEGA